MTYSRGKKFCNNFIKSLIWMPEWPEGVNVIFKSANGPWLSSFIQWEKKKKEKKSMVLLVNQNSLSLQR